MMKASGSWNLISTALMNSFAEKSVWTLVFALHFAAKNVVSAADGL